MSQHDLKKALAGLKDYQVPMNRDWQAANRVLLLQKISQDIQPMQAAWQGVRLLFSSYSRRISMSAGVVVAVVMGMVGVVKASEQTIPGDNLYAIKRTWENIKYAMAVGDDRRVELDVKLAQLRVNELSQVIKKYNPDTDNAIINKAVNDVHLGLSTVKYRLDNALVEDAKTATQIARIIDQHTDEYAKTLKAVKVEIESASDQRLNEEVGKKVNSALINVEQTGMQAVSVIVQKQGEAKVKLDDQVKNSIAKKIENSKEALENTKARFANIEKKIKRTGQVSLTPILSEGDKVQKTLDQAKDQLDRKSPQVLEDAKKSLDQGDLVDAFDKLVEANQLADEVNHKIEKVSAGVPQGDKLEKIPAGKVGLTPVVEE